MRKSWTSAIWAVAIILIASPCSSKPRTDIVRFFTAWDENFFYAAFEVSDLDIQGESKGPNQPIGGDDAVALYFSKDRRAPAIGEGSYRMTVSAAGGAEFAAGQDGQWVPREIFTFKYAVRPSGTLNDDQDDDLRFDVEMAVPWSEMGITPDLGTALSFNAVVRMKGEHEGFVSLTPGITSEDLGIPAKWWELWLRGPVQPVTIRSQNRVLSSRVLMRPPIVDGRISEVEYSEKGVFEIPKPDIVSARHIIRDFPVENLIFAHYHLDLPRDQQLVNHPFGGVLPWMSGDQIAWHRLQLLDAQVAGIDALLVAFGESDAAGASALRLQALAGALGEMDRVSEDHPMVSLLLRSQADKDREFSLDATWEVISSFYAVIPVQHRAQVRLPVSRGGHLAYPVFAEEAIPLTAELRKKLDERSKRAFGAGLLWIIPAAASGEAAVDGFFPNPRNATGRAISTDGAIKVGSITPGWVTAEGALSRADGSLFADGWEALGSSEIDWIVIDSFNGWSDGSEVAASSEYGYLYRDACAIQTSKYNGRQELSAKFLSSSIPPVLTADELRLAQLVVRNVGTRPWRAADRIRLGYRWYQGGRLYSPGLIQVPLQRDVPINGTAEFSIGLTAADSDRDPLPEGDWLIVFDLIGPDGRPFSAHGDRPLAAPVKVGQPADVAYAILAASLPAYAALGDPVVGSVSLRNDGAQTWAAEGTVSVLVTLSEASSNGSARPLNSWTVPLADPVEPGRIARVPLEISLTDAAGKPLGLPSEQDMLRVGIGVAHDRKMVARDISIPTEATLLVVGAHPNAVIIPPEQPVVGHTYGERKRFEVQVQNPGPREWAGSTRLQGRWYSLDGKELVSDGGQGKIKRGVKPGEIVTAYAETDPPPYPGQYVLRWTLETDRTEQGSPLGGGSAASFEQYVTVSGPALDFVDLSGVFDSDVIASEGSPQDGDFDGAGASFAGHLIPPLVVPNPSPTRLQSVGLFGADPAGGCNWRGIESWRWVSFAWPTRDDGTKNAIAAGGQTIPVTPAACTRIHVLAASPVAKTGEFGLVYADAVDRIEARVGDWAAPSPDDIVAFSSAYRYGRDGLEIAPAFLYDVVLKADPNRLLSGIRLPAEAAIKVLAITLEKPAAG